MGKMPLQRLRRIKGPGPGLGPTRLPPVLRGTVGLHPMPRFARHFTSECFASGVGPTVTCDTRGELSMTQPCPWPLNLCQIVPHHQSPRKRRFSADLPQMTDGKLCEEKVTLALLLQKRRLLAPSRVKVGCMLYELL